MLSTHRSGTSQAPVKNGVTNLEINMMQWCFYFWSIQYKHVLTRWETNMTITSAIWKISCWTRRCYIATIRAFQIVLVICCVFVYGLYGPHWCSISTPIRRSIEDDPKSFTITLPQAASLTLPPQAAFLASLTRTPKGLQVPWFSWFFGFNRWMVQVQENCDYDGKWAGVWK